MTRLSDAPWLDAPETVALMAALGEARFVGGAVRNTLLAMPVDDIDIATPLKPDEVSARLAKAGIKTVPTGIDHGTITAVVNGKPFEVTTLRADVETDGRHAVVEFTGDWAADASRRDFTMNALYADTSGEVFDYTGGVADAKAGRVCFVGDPITRIREDYLRILRLFRFHAWYGKGALDEAALAAASSEKEGLARLSGERIAKEMLKLLQAANPVPVLTAMGEAGILAAILPGVPAIPRLKHLVAADVSAGLAPDAVLRLAALLPRQNPLAAAESIAARFKLSNAHRDRLYDLARGTDLPAPHSSPREIERLLYRLGPLRFTGRVRLCWADAPQAFAQWRGLLHAASAWQQPQFPLKGEDVMALGVEKGPAVGVALAAAENWWIENGFPPDGEALRAALAGIVKR